MDFYFLRAGIGKVHWSPRLCSCAAALGVLDAIDNEGILKNANKQAKNYEYSFIKT
jgi:hypothetical protein